MKFVATICMVVMLSLLTEYALVTAATTQPPADAAGTTSPVKADDLSTTTTTAPTTKAPTPAPTANTTEAAGTTMDPNMNMTTGAGNEEEGLFDNVCDGGFDAASFVGGMVLCGGTLLIVYFACKYYQSRVDQEYAHIKD